MKGKRNTPQEIIAELGEAGVRKQVEEEQYIHEALEAGVKGYVLKNQVASDLIHAIQQVSRGEFYLSPGISRVVVEAYRSKSDRPADPLTARE